MRKWLNDVGRTLMRCCGPAGHLSGLWHFSLTGGWSEGLIGVSAPQEVIRGELFLGIGLFYGVLAFNLRMTFWVAEVFMGIVDCFIFRPLTAALFVTLSRGGTFSNTFEPLE